MPMICVLWLAGGGRMYWNQNALVSKPVNQLSYPLNIPKGFGASHLAILQVRQCCIVAGSQWEAILNIMCQLLPGSHCGTSIT